MGGWIVADRPSACYSQFFSHWPTSEIEAPPLVNNQLTVQQYLRGAGSRQPRSSVWLAPGLTTVRYAAVQCRLFLLIDSYVYL